MVQHTLVPLLGAAACVALAAQASTAQSTLADDTTIALTQLGMFLVPEGLPAIPVLDSTPFGGGNIDSASVCWIDGTDRFIVMRRDTSGKGGLWRVQLAPGGAASVEDLASQLPAGLGRDFADADYSVGLDALFVLENTSGLVLTCAQPATAGGSAFAPWASHAPETGVSLAVRGASHPFSVLIVTEDGRVLAVRPSGVTGLNIAGNPGWTQVETDGVTGKYLLASQGQDKLVVGKEDLPSGLPQALFDLNVWGNCGPLVPEPLDIEWDGRTGRAVALAGDKLLDCAFGPGFTTGANHVLRLPPVAFGPPAVKPKLLTTPGVSGIVGARGDLALVRHGVPDITWFGSGGSGAGSSAPVFGGGGHTTPLVLGATAVADVAGAPPSAAAFLVIGAFPLGVPLQGQLFGPLPQIVLPTATGPASDASVMLAVPADPVLGGRRIYMQWWFDDTTTPAPGDLASSQVGIFSVGTP
jgi:hypothetical protein